jgi:hypothetical protein
LGTATEAITTGADWRILAVGNPGDNASEFARIGLREPGWHTLRISAYDSPNLTGEKVQPAAAAKPVSRPWVEDKLAGSGETNR